MRLVCFAQTVHIIKVMRHWEVHTGLFQLAVPSLHTTVHKQEPASSTISSALAAILRMQVIYSQGWISHRARPDVHPLSFCSLSRSSVVHLK